MNDKELWLQIATKLFLLPLIEDENSLAWLNNKTLGIYTSDTNKPEWENKIIICYDLCILPSKIRVRFDKNPYAYAEYRENIDGNYHKIVAFNIPPNIKKDFNHLLNGEYTKVSVQTQNKILNHWAKISPKARHIVYNFFIGHTHIYQNKPKLKDAILNLNDIPIKKADTATAVPALFILTQISTNLTS